MSRTIVLSVIWGFGASVCCAQGPEYRWQPVSGCTTFINNQGSPGVPSECFIEGVLTEDVEVPLEVDMSDWGDAAGAPELRTYQVTIDGDVQGRYSHPLGEDTTIRWRTRAYDPLVYLHAPYPVGTYNGYTRTLAYVTVRNVRRVNFALYRMPVDHFLQANGEDWWRYWDDYRGSGHNLIREWTLNVNPPLNQRRTYGTNLAEDEEDTTVAFERVLCSSDEKGFPASMSSESSMSSAASSGAMVPTVTMSHSRIAFQQKVIA